VDHFVDRAHDILRACKFKGEKSKSFKFKGNLRGLMGELVREFARIGVKECE
jgi:hypothetical protein